MKDYTERKLGELLSSADETIRRNAISILKQLQKNKGFCVRNIFSCPYCGSFDVEITSGVDGSDYIKCFNCKTNCNIFEDDEDRK